MCRSAALNAFKMLMFLDKSTTHAFSFIFLEDLVLAILAWLKFDVCANWKPFLFIRKSLPNCSHWNVDVCLHQFYILYWFAQASNILNFFDHALGCQPATLTRCFLGKHINSTECLGTALHTKANGDTSVAL